MRAYSIAVLTLASLLSLLPLASAQETAATSGLIQNPYKQPGSSLFDRSVQEAAYARAVSDIVAWDFNYALQNPNWIVARVLPAGEPKTTKLPLPETVNPANFAMPPEYLSEVYSGNVSLFLPLTAAPVERLWPYRYEKKGVALDGKILKPDPFGSEGREEFSLFRGQRSYTSAQNCMILAPAESLQNLETPTQDLAPRSPEYRPYLLTDNSIGFIPSALAFYRENPDFFSPDLPLLNLPSRKILLNNSNPFLFAAASRNLAQNGQLDSDFIENRLLAVDSFKQSIFVYSALIYSPQASGKVAVASIQKALDKAQNKKQIEGILIGIDCAKRRRRDIVNGLSTNLAPNSIVSILTPSMSLALYEGLRVPPALIGNPYSEITAPVSPVSPPFISLFVPQGPKNTESPAFIIDREPLKVDDKAPVVANQTALSQAAFVRSVRDMATWDFAQLKQNPKWVVAEIIPPPNGPSFAIARSWAANPLGMDIPIMPPKSAQSNEGTLYWEGSVRVLTPLGMPPQRSLWRYRYDRIIQGPKIDGGFATPDQFGTEGHEDYSPFRHGPVDGQKRNLAICLPPESIQNAEISNADWLSKPNPYLAHIFREEWLDLLVAVQRAYENSPDFFLPENVSENRTQLLIFLDKPNPFYFAAAVRTLAQSGQMGSNYASAKLLEADRFHQAVFVYSTLLYSSDEPGRIAVGHIQKAIEKAQNKQQLEGLIIGALCAYEELKTPRLHFERAAPSSPSLRQYLPLIQTLAKKQREFGVTTDTDKYLEAIIQRIGPVSILRRGSTSRRR